ncbi:hypothetical protein QJS04_geneDACA019871 [Acorus gramineus]|uniref:DNA-directed RNA polymerase I subunit rpa49 n=1 Tax=Acorus gramineus TaxID=55184 RepID=A0AAV9BVA9_ACOGR|nr:hypothetical protein QJS04_geneDACA019871 [Acorus gramineus]
MEEERMEEAMEEEEEKSRKPKKIRKRISVSTEVVPEKPDRTSPIVGYFASGFDPQKKIRGSSPDVRVLRNRQRPTRMKVVVKPPGNDKKVEFVGTSFSGEAATPQLCTYALGVLDKESGSLKIVPIAANKIFRLEPRVTVAAKPSQDIVEKESVEVNRREKIREVMKLYGTKRTKNMIKNMDSLRQQENDEGTQEMIENESKDMVIGALEDAPVRNIPPHDVTAVVPEKAYLLDQIILRGEWDHLGDILEHMMSDSNLALKKRFLEDNCYPRFVHNRVHKVLEVQDDAEKRQLAGMLSYISYLLKFKDIAKFKKAASDFTNPVKTNENIPNLIYQKFMKMYVDPELHGISKEKNDLLISYILVLTLFVDNFKTEISDITKDLKMNIVSVRPYYEQLGCRPESIAKRAVMTLPLPLKLPVETKRRKNKRN